MKNGTQEQKIAGLGDAAVQAKTGKTWAEWLAILDKAGAGQWSHKEIAHYIHEQHGCPDWWSQMVTVGYEQARGRRDKHEAPDGYQASVSRTLPVAVADLYAAWSDEKIRNRWLPKTRFTIRKATPPKSLRITWVDGRTSVEVLFSAKGAGKSQVAIQHRKLAGAKDVPVVKNYWAKALDQLRKVLAEERA